MSMIINNNIIFIESLQFCKAALDTLAENFQNSDFKHLMSEFLEDKLKILRKKDAYPYEWVDSYKSPKEVFYSLIDDGKRGEGDGHISNEQYLHLHCMEIFTFYGKKLDLKTFKDFHNTYLKKDVLLLVDVY